MSSKSTGAFYRPSLLKKHVLNGFLLLCFLILSSFKGYSSFSQNTKIKIAEDQELSVVEIFELISSQSDHTFMYKTGLFSDSPKVQLSKGYITVEDLLNEALQNTAIDHRFGKKGSILLFPSQKAEKKEVFQKLITGTVLDDKGEPIAGAYIEIKDTNIGTVTDFDGNFTLDAKEGDVLKISFLSFKTKEIEVGADSTYEVVLEQEIGTLSEVVLTGYTNYKRSETASSITTVKSDQIEQISAGSFNDILQGKVPGMQVSSSSGQPGETPDVIVRGVGSVDGSRSPLYIMDGVPIEAAFFQTINPNDIASVNVLKDASAKALYGSRGSNGVVVITTKKGKKGKLSINYSSQYGISKRGHQKFTMMNTPQRLQFEEEVGLAIGQDIGPGWTYSRKNPAYTRSTPLEQQYADYLLDSIRAINIDWRDIFLRQGQYMDQNLSISGGNERVNFYNSVNYHEQEGIVRRTGLKRFNLRSNVGYKEGKFSAQLNMSLGFSKSRFTFNEGGTAVGSPLASMYYALPYEYPYYNGKLAPTDLDEISFMDTREGSRGLDVLQNVTSKTNQLKAIVGMDLNYEIFPFLSVMTRVGVDYRNSTDQDYTNPDSYIGSRNQSSTRGGQGAFGEGVRRNFALVSTSGITFNKKFNDLHDVEVSAFYEHNYNHYRAFNYTGYGVDDRLPETPVGITVNSTFLPDIGGRRTSSALMSAIGTGKYTYDERYTVTASYRYDGSSKVARKNRWHGFYSVGGNWDIKKEPFMKNINGIRDLNLRASYGQTASEFGGDFLYLPTYSVSTFYGNNPGIRPTEPGNPDFDWEYVDEFNVGIDLSLFRNRRVRLTTDFYNRITKNMFIDQPLSATSGFVSSVPLSTGKMRNRGVEVDLEGLIVDGKNWSWSLGTNFAYNQNEILHVTDLTDEFPDGDTRIIKVGMPYGTYKAPLWAGVNPETGESQFYTKEGEITTDYDDDKLSVPLDASYFPKFTGGFNTKLSWKNLSLTTLFTFSADVKRWNNEDFYTETNTYMSSNQSIRMLYNRWKQPGDEALLQRIDIPRHYSSKDIQDASFLRLRNVKLSYVLEDWVLDQIGFLNHVTFFVEGTNLYTWTSFRGLDPENGTAIGRFEYPAPRTYTFGINIDF